MTRERKPLNPTLYRLLVKRFGEDDVEIVSPGQAIDWSLGRDEENQPMREMGRPGEEYKVKCPLCHDHRARLHINHRWGVFDPPTNTKNLWLAHCFNEECQSEYEDRRQLYDLIYAPLSRRERDTMKVAQGKAGPPRRLGEMPPPGPMMRLDRLAADHPEHPAVVYLRARNYDPVFLGRRWGVAYCPQSRFRLASNRIIIPIRRYDGVMLGWQARFIGDDFYGVPFNKAGVPKYWTSPGFVRDLEAYNFDCAVRHPTVVIVEGPVDVWGTGPQAMALLGKTMGEQLQRRLQRAMQRHADPVVVVMLDPIQDDRARQKKKPHHIEKLYQELLVKLPGRVVDVYLPEEFDPGNTTPVYKRELMREAAAAKGLRVDFSRDKVLPYDTTAAAGAEAAQDPAADRPTGSLARLRRARVVRSHR